MDRKKGSRDQHQSGSFRKDRKRKRLPPVNRYEAEKEQASTITSAKKLKNASDIFVPEETNIGYRILNFITVFTAISECVKCKHCDGDITFKTESTRGLGFKVLVICTTCDPTAIPSCPFIGPAYEINRRFFFAMRLLGLGLNGAKKFCGIMDLPSPLAQNTYDIIVDNIYRASTTVCELLLRKAVNEEKKEMCEEEGLDDCTEFSVSGDGTWRKLGFTSLFGVSTIIGYYSSKVLDFIAKSTFCKACEFWSDKISTAKYEEWQKEHEKDCLTNHEGSAGKMEVDAIREIFSRSMERYGIKYTNYIGDGDSKTYSGIINSKPYGDNVIINKKECIGHVQKRMGSCLRECKRKNKHLGNKNKLTAKLIDELSVYYGLAIRRNCKSVELMKQAIWATFYHYSSIDKQPQHHYCPQGSESWCSWQRAKAGNALHTYKHDYQALPEDVLEAIRPIYENLSNENLLERCVGGFTQNNNESFNNMIWKVVPKVMHSDTKIVQIAACVATCVYNEGASSLLQIMKAMEIAAGPNAHQYVIKEDEHRIMKAEQDMTKEARLRRRLARTELTEIVTSAEDLLYDPGDDSI